MAIALEPLGQGTWYEIIKRHPGAPRLMRRTPWGQGEKDEPGKSRTDVPSVRLTRRRGACYRILVRGPAAGIETSQVKVRPYGR